MRGFFVSVLLLLLTCVVWAQKPLVSVGGYLGHIIPNYRGDYPSLKMRADAAINLGFTSDSTQWGSYYNYPETGVAFQVSSLGNNRALGQQFSLFPYANFRLNKKRKPLFLKFGLGVAAFTKFYNAVSNRGNAAIGSRFNWHFNITLSKTIAIFPMAELRIAGGGYHASNGHIQIPNFGLNTPLIGFELFFRKQQPYVFRVKNTDTKSYWVFELRTGLGVHELAGTAWPMGTPKYGIYSVGINAGYVHREHIKYKLGITNRYYNSFYNYQQAKGYNTSIMQASGLYIMTGTEFLLGHFGLDLEVGFNLYRPFFDEFFFTFEGKTKNADYWLKRVINSRMGLNYYLFSCYKPQRFNVRVGAHINANFGQADYADVSIGVTYRISK